MSNKNASLPEAPYKCTHDIIYPSSLKIYTVSNKQKIILLLKWHNFFPALWLSSRFKWHNHSTLIFSERLFQEILSHKEKFRANVIMLLRFPGLKIFQFLLYLEEAIGSPIIEIPVVLICLPICKLNRSLTYLLLCQSVGIFAAMQTVMQTGHDSPIGKCLSLTSLAVSGNNAGF